MAESRPLGHAVVLGGSVAGLLAARVLSDHAERVTLVERDALSETPEHRKGTPQSHHANNLVPRAVQIFDRLFPGLADELVAAGASRIEGSGHITVRGTRLARVSSLEQPFLLMTRPVLDAGLRRHIRALDRVELATERDVVGLSFDAAGGVTGVRLRGRDADAEETLESDLVVDAMGRGTRARGWLEEAGHPRPEVTELVVGVRYATRLFSRAPGDLDGDGFAVIAPTSSLPRGSVAFAVEGDRWLVTLFGYDGEEPPTELDGFRAWARGLAAPYIADLVDRATPTGEPAKIGYPKTQLHHHERLERPPAGYLALGDSLCGNNPSYGQGMCSAAFQAEALDRALAAGAEDLPRRYYPEAVAGARRVFDFNWSNDADLPGVVGPPDPTPGPIKRYIRRANRVAGRDPRVAAAMLRVVSLLAPPQSILHPSIAWRVLRG